MSRTTHEAYAYLRTLGIHPPRRPKAARALARRLRSDQEETIACRRCGHSPIAAGTMCSFEIADMMGGELPLCPSCCEGVRACGTVAEAIAFLGPALGLR